MSSLVLNILLYFTHIIFSNIVKPFFTTVKTDISKTKQKKKQQQDATTLRKKSVVWKFF